MTLPAVPDTFAWVRVDAGAVLACRPLRAVASHAFTTRDIPLASPDDWQRLADAIGASRIVTLTQVHGRGAVVVRRGKPPSGPARPEGDILVSDDPAVAIAVRAADCVPVLLADPRTGAVAAVHAGWRGTAAGAATAAVQAMRDAFGTSPPDLLAAIGPSIGACCYEVGPEIADHFLAAGHGPDDVARWFRTPAYASKPRLDTWAANRDQLQRAGVRAENIHACGLCTASHLDVFPSYRAERERAGRLAGVIRAAPL